MQGQVWRWYYAVPILCQDGMKRVFEYTVGNSSRSNNKLLDRLTAVVFAFVIWGSTHC
jgi:hypothetical protein